MKQLPLILAVVAALGSISCQTTSTTASSSSSEHRGLSHVKFPKLKEIFAAKGDATPKTHLAKSNVGKGYRSTGQVSHGKASWYEIRCNGGTHTASGETLNDYADTAAHKTLPMGTHVKVTNLANGREAVVRINDRGPYIAGRIIDVTKGVAVDLDFIGRGVTPVSVEVMEPMLERIRTSRKPRGGRNE